MPSEVTNQVSVSDLPKRWRYYTTTAHSGNHVILNEAVQRLIQLPENYSTWYDFLTKSRLVYADFVQDKEIHIVARYERVPNDSEYNTQVTIGFVCGDTVLFDLVSWVMGPYPHCCALEYVYDFRYNQQFFNRFPDGRLLFRKLLANMVQGMVNQNHRFMIAMVEYRELEKDEKDAYRQRLQVPEPVSKPRMSYPWIYEDLCLFNHGPVQKLLMYNNNTGNIIHMMEIQFDWDIVNQESK